MSRINFEIESIELLHSFFQFDNLYQCQLLISYKNGMKQQVVLTSMDLVSNKYWRFLPLSLKDKLMYLGQYMNDLVYKERYGDFLNDYSLFCNAKQCRCCAIL
jgi:hypothetical protein